jgi:hypothetical protein
MSATTLENAMEVPQKTKNRPIMYCSWIQTLRNVIQDTGYNRVMCIPMFIAALFITAKLWK